MIGFTACKKGENDPISLKSRDGRLIGTWKLTAYEENFSSTENSATTTPIVTSNVVTTTRTVISDGAVETTTTTETEVDNDGTPPTTTNTVVVTITNNSSLMITINEDETAELMMTGSSVKITQLSTPADPCGGSNTPFPSGSGLSCDGTYTYVNSGTSTSSEKTYWSWLDAKKNKVELSIHSLGTFMIDRLSSKELVLIYNTSDANSTNFTGGSLSDNSETTSKWTFEKQ